MNDMQFFEFERQDNLRQERLDRIADRRLWFCLTCKRTTIPGEVYADGYVDDTHICHACKLARNERLSTELAEEPFGGANEDTEERCQ